MYIETIDYYDEERGHRKTTVDPRLVVKLIRCTRGGTCLCRKGAGLVLLEEGLHYITRAHGNHSTLSNAAGIPLVPARRGNWVDDSSGKVRDALGVDEVLVISKDGESEDVDKKVDEVLRAWGYPGRPLRRICPHMEEL